MEQKQQIADRLKQANNILVTVSTNPSVDQLASCIGLTLALNKMGKHATAVFSGTPPSTIEFLQPEKTFASNIDSLRDFIISLDKTKADKLRYKVEDKMVKIFITPYHTSLGDKDLEFSQGDFNVEVVVALGVHNQADVDQAISVHGRILHDATVATLNVQPGGDLGSMNWLDPKASSLCELAAELVNTMDKRVVDAQIATALLTGIVAETGRFSNDKTSPATMSVSALLMAAGANQQLVVTKLEEAAPPPPQAAPADEPGVIQIKQDEPADDAKDAAKDAPAAEQPASPAPAPDAATLEVSHVEEQPEPPQPEEAKPDEDNRPVASLEDLAGPDGGEQDKKEAETPRIHIDDQGGLHNDVGAAQAQGNEAGSTDPTMHMGGSRMILTPPSMSTAMSATTGANGAPADSYSDPLAAAAKPEANASGEQPSGAPAPAPFMPSSMSPPGQLSPSTPPNDIFAGLDSPAPPTPNAAPIIDATQPAPGQPFGAPSSGPAQNAPLGNPLLGPAPGGSLAPPDLSAPISVGAPQPNPLAGLNVPTPVGAPPPVPPPMIPTSPQ